MHPGGFNAERTHCLQVAEILGIRQYSKRYTHSRNLHFYTVSTKCFDPYVKKYCTFHLRIIISWGRDSILDRAIRLQAEGS